MAEEFSDDDDGDDDDSEGEYEDEEADDEGSDSEESNDGGDDDVMVARIRPRGLTGRVRLQQRQPLEQSRSECYCTCSVLINSVARIL